jgi:hypothetical protein
MGTSVINVRGRDRAGLLADPGFVYVGRRARGGWPDSPWGNPFRLSMWTIGDGARQVLGETGQRISATIAHLALVTSTDDADPGRDFWPDVGAPPIGELLAYRDFVRSNIGALAGKTLGCWCCDVPDGRRSRGPDRLCHAVTLARLADGDPDLTGERRARGKRRRGTRARRGPVPAPDPQGRLF